MRSADVGVFAVAQLSAKRFFNKLLHLFQRMQVVKLATVELLLFPHIAAHVVAIIPGLAVVFIGNFVLRFGNAKIYVAYIRHIRIYDKQTAIRTYKYITWSYITDNVLSVRELSILSTSRVETSLPHVVVNLFNGCSPRFRDETLREHWVNAFPETKSRETRQ